MIERLNDLEGKYKQCQQSVDQLFSDNIILKERMVKVEQNKRPSYESVIFGPTEPGKEHAQLQQKQSTQDLKISTKHSILDCINSDRTAGTVLNVAVNSLSLHISEANTQIIHGNLDNISVISNNSIFMSVHKEIAAKISKT